MVRVCPRITASLLAALTLALGLLAAVFAQSAAADPGVYASRVLATPGLAHYWRLGEQTGATLADSVGASDATAQGGVTLGAPGSQADDPDTAAGFDGTDGAAAANVDLSSTSQATVEFWMKWTVYANDDRLAFELTPNFNNNDGGLLVDPNDSTGQFGLGIGRGATRNNAFFTRPSAGTWHHYAFVFDTTAAPGQQIIPYVDGEPVPFTKSANGTGAGNFANSTLSFMSRNATSLFGNGQLDEVAVYDGDLDAGTIAAHFEGTGAPDTTPPTIASRTPTDGSSGVGLGANVTATFSEPMDPATINAGTVELRDSGNSLVPATVSYDPAQERVTLDPSGPLDATSTYTATVKGGAAGVADPAGNQLAGDSSWSFATTAPPPDEGPGGPILVVASAGDPFGRFFAEILRAEGLNEFKVTDISNLSAATLAPYDVVILAQSSLSAGQVTTLNNWVTGGGNLIAMRPDPQLASLLGLSGPSGTLDNAYLKVDTATGPGAGIVDQTIQFHGSAQRYTAPGAQTIATLYSNATTATANPAVTLRSVGSNGGQAAAFSYDLARSVVYTRQGNPAWAGQERDGIGPIRSDDLFFGAKAGDPQPDWVDLNKVAIPQADEQQHLLANLIEQMNVDRKPLPRFWFLPRDEKAAVVMTGDDHAVGGTEARFQQYEGLSPPGCSVAQWQCVRATSYIYTNTGSLTNAEAMAFQSAGFEIGLHPLTNCNNWTDQAQLESIYTSQLSVFASTYPGLAPPVSSRTHCIVWSDWATQPKVELENGIRLDTNYYYWPETWVDDRPGMFTGSGMPMRFADLDGSILDVYQATTQMTDESGQSYPFTIDTLLDHALGPEGYYGVFTANMHNDSADSPGADAIIASAQARGVPIVSARQMLDWLDARNNSSFGSLAWSPGTLSFTIAHAAGATGLRAMAPTTSADGPLTQITRGGTPVATTTKTIKGRDYAFFDATAGSYQANYGGQDNTPPETTIDSGPSGPTSDATPTFTFHSSEAGSTFECSIDTGTPSFGPCSGPGAAHTPSGPLPQGPQTFRVRATDPADNTDLSPATRSFTVDTQAPGAPNLTGTSPASPANDNNPEVLGSAEAGSTVRIYSTAGCSGSPLASGTAAQLASPGITVSVADNSTAALRATATDAAGNTSSCSAALSYTEISPQNGKIVFTSKRDGNDEIYSMTADGTTQTRLTNNAASDYDPAFSPTAQKIAFTSKRNGNDEIYVMNADGTAQTRLTNNTTVDSAPVFSPDGQQIAFASSRDGNSEIYVMNVDGSSQTRLTTNTAFDGWPSFSPDGQKIAFTSLRDGPVNFEIYSMNADGTAQTRLTNNAAYDMLATFSPDGQKIAFASTRDGNFEIYSINADGSSPTRLTNNSASEAYPAFSPDGQKIAFDSNRDGNNEIYAMNANGSGQTRLTNAAGVDTTPDWGVANGKIVFTSKRDGNDEIYSMTADGTTQTRLTNNAASDYDPAFSPTAQKIAFTSKRNGNDEIYVMNADGTAQTRLTNNTTVDSAPVFSPDGQQIAFASSRDGNSEIYVMNVDGSSQTRLTTNTAFDGWPSFSPDGQKIAFTSLRDGPVNFEIYSMNADGTAQTRLTNNAAYDMLATFSPDGQKIAFASTRDGNFEIYSINADGSSPTRLTNNSASEAYPAFSPDGQKIAFDSNRDGNNEIYAMNANGSGQTRLTNAAGVDTYPNWGVAVP